MPTVNTNGIELYYEVHGAGEPLLLIMGFGANTTGWEAQIPEFSREFQVIAFDNRGAGRSEKPPEMYSIHQMADDAAALLEALGVVSAHVFGMSMGGMIAQELTLQHPGRVRSLVLGATMVGGQGAVHPNPATIQQMIALASLPLEQAIETGLAFLYSDDYLAANKARLLERSLANRHLMAPAHALQKQVMAVLGFSAHGRLKDVRVPVLVLHGTADKIIPFPNSGVLIEQIPSARLIEYPGAGHGFLVECADDLNEAVLHFLRQHRTHFVPA
jgi:3-oxoadipate enol-lactonase